MARIIKFKALSFKGKWFFGSYIESNLDAPCIIYGDGEQIEIKRETLCQFTGIYDKSGNEVYEGDIIHENGCFIVWSNDSHCWCFQHKNQNDMTPFFYSFHDIHGVDKILGNIHEN